MRVFVTGATGLIGRALCVALRGRGDEVVETGRRAPTAELLSGCGAVVHLAGESVMARRWTAERRRALRESRVDLTRRVVEAIGAASPRPRVLVSASAVGYYGDGGERELDEGSAAGTDFLAGICRDWEAEARRAEGLGVRVVLLRTGLVMSARGGALAQMLPPFRLGLGGPVGTGRQYWPWIHLEDEVAIILAALGDGRYAGPVNCVAPEAVTSRAFARALGRVLRRPAVVPVPILALRLRYGRAAESLLASARVRPRALEGWGFRFRHAELEGALRDCLARTGGAGG